MNKLYVGNLSPDANEGTLRDVFMEQVGVQPKNILVKKGGYAFVECPDPGSAERAIGILNGFSFLGTQLVVEQSVSRGARSHTNKVNINNIPSHIGSDEVQHLLSSFGVIKNLEQGHGRNDNTYSVIVTYENEEQAQRAFAQLNDYELDGNRLKVEYGMEQGARQRGGGGAARGRGYGGGRGDMQNSGAMHRMGFRQSDFPLRILVLSDMVGAIIGKQGGTIKHITQSSRARVDVHRKENVGSIEKPITIYGNPENCSTACSKILNVMQEEATNTNRGEISLKLLAHNNLIGRIIGKQGSTIKKIMDESETKITVSSIHDVSSFNLERIITVKGSLEGMAKAESMISAKLRESYQNDLASMAPQSLMFPGLHPMAMMSTLGSGGFPQGHGAMGGGRNGSYSNYGSGNYMPMMYPGSMHTSSVSQSDPNKENVFLYIPNPSVGAIIGTGGSTIREMISHSGASIKVAQPASKDEPQDRQQERKVTIVGTPEAQWKAQFMIFKKVSNEGYSYGGSQDARLRAEMLVPSNQVGRIIGKGGARVRELQQITKAIIKLPDSTNTQNSPPPQSSSQGTEETIVQISGDFYSSQAAQRQIRAVIYRGQQPPPQQRRGGDNMRGSGIQGPPPPPRGPNGH